MRSWKAPIALAIFTVLYALLILAAPRGGETTFRISTQADAIQLPEITVSVARHDVDRVRPPRSADRVRRGAACAHTASTPLWLIAAYIVIAIFGFLTWAAAGETIPVAGLLAGAVALAIPLIYGALGGVIGERAGVVNIAIEGQLLAGAFSAAVVASITGQPLLGLVAAMFAGVLVAFVLAAFAIKYLVDQVIVGVVLNVLVIGLTSFFYSQVLQPNAGAAELAAALRPHPDPDPERDPGHRPRAVPADDHRVPDVHRRRGGVRSGCSAPAGACACARSASTRRPPTRWASR